MGNSYIDFLSGNGEDGLSFYSVQKSVLTDLGQSIGPKHRATAIFSNSVEANNFLYKLQ